MYLAQVEGRARLSILACCICWKRCCFVQHSGSQRMWEHCA